MRSVVVNIPGTYPAQPNNGGVLISGFVSPTLERSVQPPALIPFLQERDYLIDVDLGLGHKDLDAFCEQLFAHHAARTRVLVDLLEGEPCDLFYVAFTGTDRLHHFLWEQMERGEEPWATRFHDYYAAVDASVGELVVAAAGRLPADPALRPRLLPARPGGVRQPLARARRLARARGAGQVDRVDRSPSGTRAYCMDPGRLYLNLAGREPGGIVAAVRVRARCATSCARGPRRCRSCSGWRRARRRSPARTPSTAPDLVLVSKNGWDLKGAVRTAELQGKGRLTGHAHAGRRVRARARRASRGRGRRAGRRGDRARRPRPRRQRASTAASSLVEPSRSCRGRSRAGGRGPRPGSRRRSARRARAAGASRR